MNKQKMTTRKKIEWILQSPMTTYQIAKESGVPITPITRLRNGSSQIDNLQFKSIEKLVRFYDTIHQENTKNDVNGSKTS